MNKYREVQENLVIFDNENITKRFVDGSYIYLTDDELNKVEESIIKSSPNIKDLIQVGDYVNGEMVTEIKDGKPFKEDYNDSYYSYYFDNIYSIVTKEQFNSMKYKLKENK